MIAPMNRAVLADVACRHGLKLVVRFGSTVTGLTHPGSDLDLAILFERFPDSAERELDALTDLQAIDCGHAVDVVVLNRADPLLLDQVARHARLEYGSERHFDEFRRYAFKRYHDHRPYLELERAYVQRVFGIGPS